MSIPLKKLAEEYPPKRKTSNIRIKYPEEFDLLVKCTNFLPKSASTSNRLWHIRNDIFFIPTCKNPDCTNECKWVPKYSDYAEYCSKKCYNFHKSSAAKDKEIERQIKKYGKNFQKLSKQEKIKITNLKLYGVDNPFRDVELIKTSNRKKYGKDYHFQGHLSNTALAKLNDRAWLAQQNHENKKTCTEIAETLGVNNTTVNKAMYRLGMRPNYDYSGSYLQEKLAHYISTFTKVLVNDRTIIGPQELDIVLPEHDIAIEVCGLYWHNEIHKIKTYHADKLNMVTEKGLKLITIFEDELRDKPEIVKNSILHKIGVSTQGIIHTRKCNIVMVTQNKKRDFFNQSHIQGDGGSSINIGLEYNNRLVACAGFKRDNEYQLTLNRFSTICKVPGALSKILKYMCSAFHYDRIITFADLRWSDGSLYERVGFKKEIMLSPDYQYIFKNRRLHKFNFRHKNLRKLLPNYDRSLSEHENCLAHNIYRIYDCGKVRYVYDR